MFLEFRTKFDCKSDREKQGNELEKRPSSSLFSLNSSNASTNYVEFFESNNSNTPTVNNNNLNFDTLYSNESPVKKMKNSNSVLNHTNQTFTKVNEKYVQNSEQINVNHNNNHKTNHIPNFELKDKEVRRNHSKTNHINNSHNKIITEEFFNSEKQVNKKKSVAPTKMIFHSINQNNKNPIRNIKKKQEISLNTLKSPELKQNYLFYGPEDKNISKAKYLKFDKNDSDEEKLANELTQPSSNNMKTMLHFLKEKLGDKVYNELLKLVNFSTNENIMNSLNNYNNEIFNLLGDFYKQNHCYDYVFC